jgi:hypothetical protein
MAYSYHIRWKDPEGFPGTAFANAEERCRVYSNLHDGVFSVFKEPPGSDWLFYTMKGSISPLDVPLVSYRSGKKIYPNE